MNDEQNLHAFQDWLLRLISEWRREVSGLPPGVALPESGPLFRFDAPCQIDVLRIFHPLHRLDYRLCIVTHFDDEPDLRICVWGPYYPSEAAEAVERYVGHERWQRPLPEEAIARTFLDPKENPTYSDALASSIQTAYGQFKTYVNNTVKSTGVSGKEYGAGLLPGDCFSWGIAGEIELAGPDPAAWVARRLAQELRAGAPPTSESAQDGVRPRVKALGAFLLPNVWVGSVPHLRLSEMLEGAIPVHTAHRNVVLRMEHDGLHLTATQSGFFGVTTEDPVRAARCLNGIFARLLFAGRPSMSVSPTDMVHIYDIGTPLASYSYSYTVGNEQRRRLEGEKVWFENMMPHALLDKEVVVRAVSSLGKLDEEPKRFLVMEFCLEAWTQLARRDYRGAFLSAWTAIELDCYELWRRLLVGQGADQTRMRALERWDINRVIQMLEALHALEDGEVQEVQTHRTRRNQVAHAGVQSSRLEAVQALQFAMKLTAKTWQLTCDDTKLPWSDAGEGF